jgi:GT2 family glycosyltransferase
MRLSIIIPVYNNWHLTESCLKDLAPLPDDHEIVLVDNGSTDTTKKLSDHPRDIDISEFHKNLEVFRFKENRGFAGACNLGFAKSLGEYVMFLNNDIRVRTSEQHCWTQHILAKAQDGYLVSPTAGKLDEGFNFVCESDKLAKKGYVYLSGWNLTGSRQILTDLQLKEYCGPFTEEFTTYFEDTDLSLRAQEKGIALKVVPVPVRHLGKMTSKKLDTLKLYLPAKEKFITKWKDRAKPLLLE